MIATRNAADVRARRQRFLSAPWVPLGELTLLAGEPGLGKSTLIAHYAAHVTRGTLPGDLQHTPSRVLIAGTEESIEATVVPRLRAAGADLALVDFLTATDETGRAAPLTIPDDLEDLEAAIAAAQARLITFDPLSAFLSAKVNSWREHDVRRALTPLAEVARQADAAVLGVAHLNKGDAIKLMERVGGSVGFGATVRSVIAFGRDPSDQDGPRGPRRIIAHAKCNVAAEADPLAATRESCEVTLDDGTIITASRLRVTGPAQVEADDLLATREEWTARDDAAAFLLAELADGPVASKVLQRRAEEAGHSWRTVRRAKDRLAIRTPKQANGEWAWELRDGGQLPRDGGHLDLDGGQLDPHSFSGGGQHGQVGHLPVTTGRKLATPSAKVAKVAKVATRNGEADEDTFQLATPEQEAAAARAQSLLDDSQEPA